MCGELVRNITEYLPPKAWSGLCAFDDKRCLHRDGIHTLAHGHYVIRREQTEDFDESTPESALTTPSSTWNADEDNVDVSGFITLSNADSVRQGLQPNIARAEAIAMVGDADLPREIDGLSAIRDADDGDNEWLHHTLIDDDDEDDDANEVDDLLSIDNVTVYTEADEPY
jgi:hypothetical protein